MQQKEAGPLKGIRVLDLSQGAAGPICTMILGDLGAEIIKVEPPDGDWGRGLGPPFIGDSAAIFYAMNRNKKSIVVNLKKDAALEIIRRLARNCDVFVESFRPGVVDRLGIGYQHLSNENKQLIYCSLSAYGQSGPWKDKPGVDGVIQAVSGFMSTLGVEDGPPVKVPTALADFTTGFLACQGIMAALIARSNTNQGQKFEISLFDSMMLIQQGILSMYLASGELPKRTGSAAPYASPNEAFPSKDGFIMVAAYSPQRWVKLCEVLGRPELHADSRFSSNADRVKNRHELVGILSGLFQHKTTDEWLKILEEADIICAPVATFEDVIASPQIKHSEMIISVEHPLIGHVRMPNIVHRFSKTPGSIRLPAPALGEQTEKIMQSLGFNENEISTLCQEGVIAVNLSLKKGVDND